MLPPPSGKQFIAISLILSMAFLITSPKSLNAQEETLCEIYGHDIFLPIGSSGNTTNASSLSNTNFTTGTKLYIEGTLLVNVNVSFSGCIVRMGTDAQIVTSGTVNLVIQNSYFFSCDDMWQGIVLQPNVTTNITGTEFEDALTCFTINTVQKTSFSGNTFDRNRIGILVSAPFAPYPFSNNTFTCNSMLNAPWDGTISRSGIEVNNSIADLIAYNLGDNVFSNMQCGILAQQSFVRVGNALFTGMTHDGEDFGGQPGGSGIIALGGVLDINPLQSGYNASNDCEFNGNDKSGITTRATILRIVNALFINNRFGIDSRENPDGQSIGISWCKFLDLGLSPLSSGSVFGIYLERSNNSKVNSENDIFIHNNQFETEAISPAVGIYGIRVVGAPAATSACIIRRNVMENFSPKIVIFISIIPNGADHFFVELNEMEFHEVNATLTDRFGIEIQGGNGFENAAYTNTIWGDGGIQTVKTFSCGFHVVGSHDFRYCQNSTDFGFRGFHFGGVCNGTDFIENIIGHHNLGLHLSKTGEIGTQTRTLNTWSTDAGAYVTEAAWNQNPAWINARFIVHSDDPKFLPVQHTPSDWFIKQGEDETTCNELYAEVELDSFDRKVALGNYEPDYAVQSWDAERRLYYKLLRFAGFSTTPVMSDFFDEIDNTSAGKFAKADFALWEAILMTESAQEGLDDIRLVITAKADSLVLLDSLLAIAFDSVVQSRKNLLMQTLNDLIEDEQEIRDQAFDDRSDALDAVATLISNLPQTTDYEQAHADYMGLVINKWQGLAFSSGDLTAIQTLSVGADSTIGVTALDARSLLPAGDSLWLELFDPSCLGGGSEERPVNDLDEKSKQYIQLVELQPNPAREQVQIRLSRQASGRVLLYDMTGRSKKETGFVNTHKFVLETAGLTPGVYTCMVRFDDGTSGHQKLIITH